jgi:hypothetical protein
MASSHLIGREKEAHIFVVNPGPMSCIIQGLREGRKGWFLWQWIRFRERHTATLFRKE